MKEIKYEIEDKIEVFNNINILKMKINLKLN